jgi:single-stranded-DNA-specific exonuclease
MAHLTKWCERTFDGARAAAFAAAGCSAVAARILASRGVAVEALDDFLDPSLERIADPNLIPGVDVAVQVILPFLRSGKIVVFGDYDADGVCASAILVTALRRLGANADAFIPLRFGEGYGMTGASTARLFREHPDVSLVITVDNGITSPVEIASMRARGVAVVVTDHHLPGPVLPEADALVNPGVAAAPGCEALCGAGVAFFLAAALAKAAAAAGLYSGPKFAGPLLVLAGLATVVDLVPLVGQNRILVMQSLANFSRCAPLGLRALLQRAARSVKPMAVRDYSFVLGPRINAAGRMDTAKAAYDLLMCENGDVANDMAFRIDHLNVSRRGEEQRIYAAACALIDGDRPGAAIVVRGEDWNPGVSGIVAARLMETYHVPVAVVVGDTGSVRVPDGYNVRSALDASADHLVRYGGHAAAGGFTVRPGEFDAFKTAFVAACAGIGANASETGAVMFDGWMKPEEITLELCDMIRGLEPFGEGNPEPVFGMSNVAFSDVRVVGMDGRHAAITFAGNAIPRAVWWGHGQDVEALRAKSMTRYDVLFTPAASDYGGELHVELHIVALRPIDGLSE